MAPNPKPERGTTNNTTLDETIYIRVSASDLRKLVEKARSEDFISLSAWARRILLRAAK